MVTALRRFFLLTTPLLTIVLACAKDRPSLDPRCSTGEPYHFDHSFPSIPAFPPYDINGPASENPPECVARCGYGSFAGGVGVHPYEALPSGSCAPDDQLCSMHAKAICPCRNDPGFPSPSGGYGVFYCRCVDGSWACSLVEGNEVPYVECRHADSADCIPNPYTLDAGGTD